MTDDRGLALNQTDAAQGPPQQQDQDNTPDASQEQGGGNMSPANVTNSPVQQDDTQGGAPKLDPLQTNPVEHDESAGVFRSLFTALAGPSARVSGYQVNPHTGRMEPIIVKRPSTGTISKGIIAGALTGLFAGSQQKNAIAGFGAGGQATVNMNQKNTEDQQNTAQQDLVRKQGIFENNFRTLNNAIQLGRMQKQVHDEISASSTDYVDNIKKFAPDLVIDGLDNGQAKEYAAKGYDIKPYGPAVPRFNKDGSQVYLDQEGNVVDENTPGAYPAWDNNYVAIDNKKKFAIADVRPWLENAIPKWGGVVPGLNDNLLKGAPGGSISAYNAHKMQAQTTMLDLLQAELNQFTGNLNTGKKTNDDGFVKPISLKSALQSGAITLQDVENFQKSSAHSTQPDIQLDQMRQDPNPKIGNSVGKLMNLFGPQNLEQYKTNREEAKKSNDEIAKIGNVNNENDAKAVIASPEKYSPEQVKSAKNFLQQGIDQAKLRTAAEEGARQEADKAANEELDKFTTEPEGFKYDPRIGKMSMTEARDFLKSQGVPIPSNFAALYNTGIDHGNTINKAFPTRLSRGTGQMDVTHATDYITQFLNPDFHDSDFDAAKKFNEAINNPKTSPVTTAKVATQHIDLLEQAGAALDSGQTRILNHLANVFGVETGKDDVTTFRAIAQQVNNEVAKVVAGSTPLESEVAQYKDKLNEDQSPNQRQNVIRAYVRLMGGRLGVLDDDSMRLFKRHISLDANTNQVFKKYGGQTPWVEKHTIPAGATPIHRGTANGPVIGYKDKNGQKTYF